MHTLVLMTDQPSSGVSHPESARVAAFLDGRLNARDRDVIVAHLADCSDCREEVVQLRQALASVPPYARSKRLSLAWSAVGLAALLFVALWLPRPNTGSAVSDVDDQRIRVDSARVPTDAVPPILLVEPADEGSLSASDRALRWHSSGADAMYGVTVQDTTGSTVWFSTSADTTTAIPDSVSLARGHRYYWTIDARRADGLTARSQVQSFIVK